MFIGFFLATTLNVKITYKTLFYHGLMRTLNSLILSILYYILQTIIAINEFS